MFKNPETGRTIKADKDIAKALYLQHKNGSITLDPSIVKMIEQHHPAFMKKNKTPVETKLENVMHTDVGNIIYKKLFFNEALAVHNNTSPKKFSRVFSNSHQNKNKAKDDNKIVPPFFFKGIYDISSTNDHTVVLGKYKDVYYRLTVHVKYEYNNFMRSKIDSGELLINDKGQYHRISNMFKPNTKYEIFHEEKESPVDRLDIMFDVISHVFDGWDFNENEIVKQFMKTKNKLETTKNTHAFIVPVKYKIETVNTIFEKCKPAPPSVDREDGDPCYMIDDDVFVVFKRHANYFIVESRELRVKKYNYDKMFVVFRKKFGYVKNGIDSKYLAKLMQKVWSVIKNKEMGFDEHLDMYPKFIKTFKIKDNYHK